MSWTWSDAGEQAFYGIITVFMILTLLTLLTRLSSIVITRIKKPGASPDDGVDNTGKTGG